MKVLFAGPSLYGSREDTSSFVRRGPAAQGDLARAVLEGAEMIGLIDGYFGWRGSVWHKEILFALSRGVRVLGAASMGALRAAECQQFGLEPIGEIARKYASGVLDDDAAVALTHASADEDYRPLTEPLVDVIHRTERLLDKYLISGPEAMQLVHAAQALFFQDRTVDALLYRGLDGARAEELRPLYLAQPSLKQRDAESLITAMGLSQPQEPTAWDRRVETPVFWVKTLADLEATTR